MKATSRASTSKGGSNRRAVTGHEDEPAEVKDLVTVFKALSDETRLRILKLLERGELCVCDIVAAFDMVQPKVSFHLRALKEAGLVKDRKEGKWMHYRLDDSDLFKRFLMLSVVEKIPRGSRRGRPRAAFAIPRAKKRDAENGRCRTLLCGGTPSVRR